MLYNKILEQMEISETKQEGLACAINTLHSELCKLDAKNLQRIKEKGLNEMLKEFANAEELALIDLTLDDLTSDDQASDGQASDGGMGWLGFIILLIILLVVAYLS